MSIKKTIYFENLGEKIEGILHLPEKKTDSLIILVSGFAITKDGPAKGLWIRLASALVSKNFAALRFNFRFVSDDFSQFHKITISGKVSDLKLVIEEMSKRFSKIGLVGESMGGLISVLAYDKRINCLVLWYPGVFREGTDLEKRFLSKEAEKELKETGFIRGKKSDGREYKVGKEFVKEFKDLNPVPFIKKIHSPTLIIHGENDSVVPFFNSEKLLNLLECHKKLEKIQKVCHAWKNRDYTTDYNFEAQQKAIKLTIEWLEKWLK